MADELGLSAGIKGLSSGLDSAREAGKSVSKQIENIQKDAVDVAQQQAQERMRAKREAEFKKERALIRALEQWKHKKQISDEEADLKIKFVKQYGAKEWKDYPIGLIAKEDLPIVEAFNGEKLAVVDVHNLKSTLAYIFTLIGLTRLPEKMELDIIEDYIRTTYPHFTINEFRIAFKMAVQGRFECNTDHFEKFSPKYISQIMNAYKAKANEVRKNIPPPPEPPVPQLTDDEIVEFTKNEWLNGKRQDFNKVFNAEKVFAILLKQKKLQFTPEEILYTIKVVREDNLQRINKMHPLDAKEFSKSIKNEDFIETQCKKLALVKYFENLSN